MLIGFFWSIMNGSARVIIVLELDTYIEGKREFFMNNAIKITGILLMVGMALPAHSASAVAVAPARQSTAMSQLATGGLYALGAVGVALGIKGVSLYKQYYKKQESSRRQEAWEDLNRKIKEDQSRRAEEVVAARARISTHTAFLSAQRTFCEEIAAIKDGPELTSDRYAAAIKNAVDRLARALFLNQLASEAKKWFFFDVLYWLNVANSYASLIDKVRLGGLINQDELGGLLAQATVESIEVSIAGMSEGPRSTWKSRVNVLERHHDLWSDGYRVQQECFNRIMGQSRAPAQTAITTFQRTFENVFTSKGFPLQQELSFMKGLCIALLQILTDIAVDRGIVRRLA